MKNNAKYTFFSKLIEFVKKFSNIFKTENEKPHQLYYLIFYSLAHFVKPVWQSYFCLIENLTNCLAINRVELKKKKLPSISLNNLLKI